MKRRINILIVQIATTILLAANCVGAQDSTPMNVKIKPAKSLCIISLPGGNAPGTDKPMELEFTYRPSDGIFRVAVLVNGWPKAQAADPDHDFPLTLTFNNGQKTSSNSGGYSSGFNDKLWGIWNAGEDADNALSMFQDTQKVGLSADGMNIGEFDLQKEGMIYNWINICVAEKKN